MRRRVAVASQAADGLQFFPAPTPLGSAGGNLFTEDFLTPKSMSGDPKLMVGSDSETKIPRCNVRTGGVPFPTQLRIPGARIVNIVSGGMSFHALDSEGNIYVWGALNGQLGSVGSDGFSQPGARAPTPLRLELPSKIKHISCGRLHACALDFSSRVWNFTSWGRPFTLSSPQLLPADSRPIQVECGWAFSSLLTTSGEVLVWWPLSGSMQAQIEAHDTSMDERHRFGSKRPVDGVIPCATWDLAAEPARLPGLPSLPKLTAADNEVVEEIRIVKIAALAAHIVALTNQGHVLMFFGLDDEDIISTHGRWQYLPNFSELDRVCAMPPFTSTDASQSISPPQALKITHISAQFEKFYAYSLGSFSVVLMGNTDTTEESPPHIEPALQNKSVISIVVGDWHNAALTASGKLLTWGGYSGRSVGTRGPHHALPPGTPGAFETEELRLRALNRGLGTPAGTEVPTEVRFDHATRVERPKERFCFAACAGGWQCAALVIDLDDNGEDEISEEKVEDASRRPNRPLRGAHRHPLSY
ncbi:RCC1/BLIP-II protein [Mycena venus]|uniref:RCC1/BLIP-II protein n=1 Tax=Mycena venus TaxID=2733690 RepID=A0A8H6YL96_9AGAR|nr:RCC1/BLIP-II protein [Mycena venus]